jgi:hypothetical protein
MPFLSPEVAHPSGHGLHPGQGEGTHAASVRPGGAGGGDRPLQPRVAGVGAYFRYGNSSQKFAAIDSPLLRSDLTGVATEGTCRVDGRAFRDALLQAAALRGVDARTGVPFLANHRRPGVLGYGLGASAAREYGAPHAGQIGRLDPSRTRQQYGRVAHSPKLVSDEF